jgi:predicted metal-dependent phosphoesterase TrpH
VPISRRSSLGVPVGVRANVRLALQNGRFDIVHGFEPGLPSISYVALRDSEALGVATFFSPERLGFPPRRALREKLLARIDALTAAGEEVVEAAAERFPGDYAVLPLGVDTELFRPERSSARFVLEWQPDERLRARAAIRALRALPVDWELVVVRTRPLSGRPYVPRGLRGRVRVRTTIGPESRAHALRGAAGFIPALRGSARLLLEAQAAGVPTVDPPASAEQPELVGAAMARLAEDEAWRDELAGKARARAEDASFAALAAELEQVYRSVARRRRGAAPAQRLAEGPAVLCDLHLHTEHSYDCSVPVADLLDRAEAIGLAAIAITDHDSFAGAREAVELARGRDVVVIPGEEVKTDSGEVIGLFLHEEIPGGMSMGATIAAIREQGGLVYLPHPFDRRHTIPTARTLHRHLAEIDVFEVYNARLLLEGYNDEALRFARKYNLTMGAGSDAHVLQGVGTGLVRMPAFETPEEFLLALASAEIVRRPRSLVYLQGLKWVAQARGRTRAAAQ